MLLTSLSSFLTDAKEHKTVPVIHQFFSDTITPIQLVQQFGDDAVFLLESNDEQSPWSRYSFIGLEPYLFLKEMNKTYYLEDLEGNRLCEADTFVDVFLEALSYVDVKQTDVPIPFRGGAVGYVAYDAIESFEPSLASEAPAKQPAIYFSFCKKMIAFDHHAKELFFIDFRRVGEGESENTKIFEQALQDAEQAIAKLTIQPIVHQFLKPLADVSDVSFEQVRSNYKKEKFLQDVETIKAHIEAGDISQAVLSQCFEIDVTVPGLDIYRVLRMVNPSPYLFYLRTDAGEIIGSSPERLFQIEDGHMEIHPIAGTRKRGKTQEEDDQLAEELLQDKKEIIEHEMLVDLAREDLGRVAEPETIETPVLKVISRFSHVMHIISKVTARIRSDVHPFEAFTSSFPAGTVSGAPKVRAMEILAELEPTKRGIYAGAIAYLGFDGNIDSCIAIRTMTLKNGVAKVQAGAGIVSDSVPEKEFEETENKAKALIKAIQLAESLFQQMEEEIRHV